MPMTSHALRLIALCVLLGLPAGRATATPADEAEAPRPKVASSASVGSFLAFTHPAALDRQGAYATGMGGYDSARGSGLYEAAAEVRLWGPLSLRGGALHPVASRLLLGIDGRLRFDLGASSAKREPTLDALVGPAATVLLGPVAFLVHAGASAFRLDAHSAYGMFVLSGLGTAF